MERVPDSLLVPQAVRRSVEAIEELFERHTPILRGYTNSHWHKSDADDVFQETVRVALESIGTFQGDAAFSTWLIGIARKIGGRTVRGSRKPHIYVGDLRDLELLAYPRQHDNAN